MQEKISPDSASVQRTLTVAELAEVLGVSQRHIRNLLSANACPIPPLRGIGRLVRFSKATVETYLSGGVA